MMQPILTLIFNKTTVWGSLKLALIIGTLLNLINQGQTLINGLWLQISYIKLFLTYLVPYLVSTYGTVKTLPELKPGNTAAFSTKLTCDKCKKSSIYIKKGNLIPNCGNCTENTKWKITL